MIDKLTVNHTTHSVCLSLGLNRSSYQYQLTTGRNLSQSKDLEDTLIRDAIERIILRPGIRYGYRPMTKQLQRENFLINGQFVNHKRVLRIMRDNSLLCEIKKSFMSTTDSDHNFRKY